MRHSILITATLLLVAGLFLSFRGNSLSNEDQPKPDNYQAMWKSFQKHFEDNLPESAGKVLDSIERQAEQDHNQVQLLKAILYRQKVMRFTVEEYDSDDYIEYAVQQLGRLDEAPRAVLHEEIAKIYADYLQSHRNQIVQNTAIDGDLSQVKLKYWDK
ncbi:MAG: hypothetical protein J5831_03540, partial [Bacteroidales bacterium]|nr:hypothetical protein [Bacteroidales bacterium]